MTLAPVWSIEFDAGVEKDLKKLGKTAQQNILDYLETRIATGEDPRRFGKALRGKLSGLWRYRVEDYRVICRIEDHHLIVFVVAVGHRSDIYE